MLAATTKSMAASVVIGISAASGINTRRIMVKVMQWVIPAIGVRPPFRTLAAVLAMAPGGRNSAEETGENISKPLSY